MRTLIALAVLAFSAPSLMAQEATDILAGLRAGGGWASVPIVSGRGFVSTAVLPTVGMGVAGCVTVWPGHSGTFEISAYDNMTDSSLVILAEPGEGVTFAHTFGMQAQLDFAVRWTEPRDTVLHLWIGLAIGRTREEACEPVYAR